MLLIDMMRQLFPCHQLQPTIFTIVGKCAWEMDAFNVIFRHLARAEARLANGAK